MTPNESEKEVQDFQVTVAVTLFQ